MKAMKATQLLDSSLIASLIERARRSPRRRINHNFHASPEDNPHRFLNVLIEGTYVAPHRHLNPPKSESFLVLEGRVALFTFHPDGAIEAIQVLGGDPIGADLAPGIFHTIAVLTPYAVCYEVKPGPYSPATDKDFADWAPREGDPAAPAYLARLISCVP
jgi:cupin fold WbuC family metalloprotein